MLKSLFILIPAFALFITATHGASIDEVLSAEKKFILHRDTTSYGSNAPNRLPSELGGYEVPGIGVNQTWQGLIDTRTIDTLYQNTTNRPILVTITAYKGQKYNEVFVDDVKVTTLNSVDWANAQASVIVPIGSKYYVSGDALEYWIELR